MNKHVKLSLKIFCSIIGISLTACLVWGQINICTFSVSNYSDHRNFFRNIAENNPNFGDVPLTKIAMLASHDSLSNDISVSSGPNVNETTNPVNIGLLRTIGKGAAVRFSRAQNDDVYGQLNAGVRYIDLRITKINGAYYNSHGLLANTLEHNLKLILKWLDENPGEFIIFNIVRFYDGGIDETSQKDYKALKNFMSSVKYNNKNIFDYDYNDGEGEEETEKLFCDLNYNNICPEDTETGNRKAGAVIMRVDGGNDPYNLFTKHGQNALSSNAKSIDSDKVLKNIRRFKEDVKKLGDERFNYLIINESQTQPGDGSRIFGSFLSWSLLSKAHEHNNYVLEQPDIKDIMTTLPIYMCDYSTSNDTGFNDSVINKLTEIDLTLKKE